MNDGGGDGAGCFDIKEWADTTELTNAKRVGVLSVLSPVTGLKRMLFTVHHRSL